MNSKDLNILIKKISFFLDIGINNIALLFDDLPNNFKEKNGQNLSEGKIHAQLINSISRFFKKPFFVVPRIYAEELVFEDKNYLTDYGNQINKSNITFFSGEYVVSNVVERKLIKNLKDVIKTKIIIWDNFYANDYCPRRIFVGPFTGRNKIDNIMINPTGLIETDLLILDIVESTKNLFSPKLAWKKVLKNHGIPNDFFEIASFFLKPDFGTAPILEKILIKKKYFECLDYLLWKWKSPISREWYPYLLGLKHDLQLLNNSFTKDRIIKTQTTLLSNYIIHKQESFSAESN